MNCFALNSLSSTTCASCAQAYAKYGCSLCLVFDSKWSYFHCNSCGMCRIGDAFEYKHCGKCKMCVKKDVEHICFETTDCPICYEDLKNSTDVVLSLSCGHYIHKKCANDSITKCPFCRKPCVAPVDNSSLKVKHESVIKSSLEYLKTVVDKREWDGSEVVAFRTSESLSNYKDIEENIWSFLSRTPGMILGKYENCEILEKEETVVVAKFRAKFPKNYFSLFGEYYVEFCVLIAIQERDKCTIFTVSSITHSRAPKFGILKRGTMNGGIVLFHKDSSMAFVLKVHDSERFLTNFLTPMENFLKICDERGEIENGDVHVLDEAENYLTHF